MGNSKFLDTAQLAVEEAEKVVLKYFKTNLRVSLKSDRTPVTIVDKEVEKVIKSIISKQFPKHGFFGEEYGRGLESTEYLWTIDPIDGTKNFVRGLPFFSTELSLIRNGEIMLGMSNSPILKKRLWATKGNGTFINNKKTYVSKINSLENSYLSFGGIKYFQKLNKIDSLIKLSKKCMATRGFGDAWSYQMISEGKIDMVIEAEFGGLYDVAAEVILVREAGGRVTDLLGDDFSVSSRSVIATNGLIHDEVVQYFNS